MRRRHLGVRTAPHALLVLAGLSALVGGLPSASATPGGEETRAAGPDEETRRILHLLRRATFAPRPEDVEEVRRMGREAWVARQLRPEAIPDREVEARLDGFRTLSLSPTAYLGMLESGAPPVRVPGRGEDPDRVARERQREIQRLRDLGRREVPASILLRAVYSRRQLQEVLLEFWRNHFNVDVNKDAVRYYVADWEREVLRRHVLGSFEDLLLATARHPAMLFYLDNHVSQAPRARGEKVLAGREKEGRTDGLNENYARELMELHTLGVDNGYDQDDVIQLALVLTGWSIERAGDQRGSFVFQEPYHAKGRKRVLGRVVKDGGVEEGEAVLRHLASHSNTRTFICRKLVRFLVADDPPADLVQAAEAAWKRTKGDLREVIGTILLHEAFYEPTYELSKARTPFEYAVAALRVTGAEVKDPSGVLDRLRDLDQPVYECEDPTGYSDRASDWMDAGALAVRWLLVRDLTRGRLPGVNLEASPLTRAARDAPEAWPETLGLAVFAGQPVPARTLDSVKRRLEALSGRSLSSDERREAWGVTLTLLLGSTSFQRQ